MGYGNAVYTGLQSLTILGTARFPGRLQRVLAIAASLLLVGLVAIAMAVMPIGRAQLKAYADEPTLTAVSTMASSSSSSGVRYIAVIGADTWVNGDGSYHTPASDLTALVRLDAAGGTVSILTVPRDTEYSAASKLYKSAKNLKCNQAFKYGFSSVAKMSNGTCSNYDAAIKAGAKATCKMLTSLTGIKVKEYAVVDLYTFQDIVNKLGKLKVKLPLPIVNYRLYSNGQLFTLNDGKDGIAKLNGWDAMIASRARKPYAMTNQITGKTQYKYTKKSQYKGSYSNLLLEAKDGSGDTLYYYFSDDSIRQFLDRRMFASLLDQGLGRSEGAASFVWDQLVANKLMWTNISKADVTSLANSLSKAKKANKFVVYGASALTPDTEKLCYDNGEAQYLIPMDANNTSHYKKAKDMTASQKAYHTKQAKAMAQANAKQMKAAVKQFKAGELVTAGWGEEAIIGIAKGAKKKSGGVTYKATSNANVTVVKAPNKKSVIIPDTVKLNGKTYKVTATAASAFKGKKIRTVTLGANIKKIAANTFKGSKATKLVLKTTKLTKAKVKNSLKGSKIKTIKVSVAKAQKKATVKKYKKYFTKKNAAWTVKKRKLS